jgi:hypothetical protein
MIFVFLGVAIPRRLMYNIHRKYCKGDGNMNKAERKAMVRKIGYVLRAASGRQLESIWRYVKWVVFGEWE